MAGELKPEMVYCYTVSVLKSVIFIFICCMCRLLNSLLLLSALWYFTYGKSVSLLGIVVMV